MPSKLRRPTQDIRSYFRRRNDDARSNGTQPGGATASQDDARSNRTQPGGATASQTATPTTVRMKQENVGDCTDKHSHKFIVKFEPRGSKHDFSCDQPRTVLQAIKSHEDFKEKITCPDENIIIQTGEGSTRYIIATHFPCSCIDEGELLTIWLKGEKVERAAGQHHDAVLPKDKYSVFYISREGGLHTKRKELFRKGLVKHFEYLVVYGKKGMTVKEALERDGRFVDDLGHFKLANENRDLLTLCSAVVDDLHGEHFKIRLPQNKRKSDEMEEGHPSGVSVLDVARQRGVSVRAAMEEEGGVNMQEIYERLEKEFPGLKRLMESRLADASYQKALSLRKENFGKIQQSFSAVHRVQKLLRLGNSVCKLVVSDKWQGTGFVLFDNFILTNAHVFEGCLDGERLQDGIEVTALFNYVDPEPETDFYSFEAKDTLIDYDVDFDYAILELHPQGKKHKLKSKVREVMVPPGLLEKFAPLPKSGEACLIGHPSGDVQQMDPTWIIETKDINQAVSEHLEPYKDTIFTILPMRQHLKNQGIEDIMIGGKKAGQVAFYNTFMYHGSSGSPVVDGFGRVFGLHTAGFTCNLKETTVHVGEFAYPLLSIFEKFVGKLRDRKNEELLEKVTMAAKNNRELNKILQHEPLDPEEPMDLN